MNSALAKLIDPTTRAREDGVSRRNNIHDLNRLRLIEGQLLAGINRSLECGRQAAVFVFHVVKYRQAYDLDHQVVADALLHLFRSGFDHVLSRLCRNARVLSLDCLWDDDLILLMEAEKGRVEDLLEIQGAVPLIRINRVLNEELSKTGGGAVDVQLGYSFITDGPDYLQLKLQEAVRKALKMIRSYQNLQTVYLPTEFKGLIRSALLRSVYQPILSLRSGQVIGWEALVRGPGDSYFQDPEAIFTFAEEIGLLPELEKACWSSALRNTGELEAGQRLFLNVHPHSCENSNFLEKDVFALVDEAGQAPQKIVIEITERHDIADFAKFKNTLKLCRDCGFQIALDDVGSGFSCLKSIAELRPDFIKLSTSLVQGVHRDRAKYILLETFTSLAEKTGSSLIAEGIEDEEDLRVLVNIGVHHGQGYFFSKPGCPKPVPSEEVRRKTGRLISGAPNPVWKYPLVMGEIADFATTVDAGMKVRDVKAFFERNVNVTGVVVQQKGCPSGLVMRYHLDRYLGTLYGVPLYFDKPISRIMDTEPMIVDENTPIDSVSQIAMNREKSRLYDYIIVMSGKSLKGVVSIQKIFDTMTKVRLELAKGSNPLTGLPGNLAFERELTQRRSQEGKYSFVFADLDHFKSYNDKYGFERGDKVLLFTADLMKSVLGKFGAEGDFLGHIGGDDFYMFTERTRADDICRKTVRYFDRLVKSHYDEEDRRAGGIVGVDRDGKERTFPLIAISLAVIDIDSRESFDLKQMLEQVVHLKRYAKSIPGSVYVRDRRGSPGASASRG